MKYDINNNNNNTLEKVFCVLCFFTGCVVRCFYRSLCIFCLLPVCCCHMLTNKDLYIIIIAGDEDLQQS